jgi:hypothetical protein
MSFIAAAAFQWVNPGVGDGDQHCLAVLPLQARSWPHALRWRWPVR